MLFLPCSRKTIASMNPGMAPPSSAKGEDATRKKSETRRPLSVGAAARTITDFERQRCAVNQHKERSKRGAVMVCVCVDCVRLGEKNAKKWRCAYHLSYLSSLKSTP